MVTNFVCLLNVNKLIYAILHGKKKKKERRGEKRKEGRQAGRKAISLFSIEEIIEEIWLYSNLDFNSWIIGGAIVLY